MLSIITLTESSPSTLWLIGIANTHPYIVDQFLSSSPPICKQFTLLRTINGHHVSDIVPENVIGKKPGEKSPGWCNSFFTFFKKPIKASAQSIIRSSVRIRKQRRRWPTTTPTLSAWYTTILPNPGSISLFYMSKISVRRKAFARHCTNARCTAFLETSFLGLMIFQYLGTWLLVLMGRSSWFGNLLNLRKPITVFHIQQKR